MWVQNQCGTSAVPVQYSTTALPVPYQRSTSAHALQYKQRATAVLVQYQCSTRICPTPRRSILEGFALLSFQNECWGHVRDAGRILPKPGQS